MSQPASLFSVLNSKMMAARVTAAKQRVIFVAPGIQWIAAEALAHHARRGSLGEIVVSLDFDEQVLRLGYGDLKAVECLRSVGIEIRHSPGLRTAFFIVDEAG